MGLGAGSRYDRISGADAANLASESPAAPMQVALVGVLDAAPLTGPDGLDLDRLRRDVAARVAGLDRLRRVLVVPRIGGGSPVWADGPPFEPGRHVVAHPLDPPGDEAAFRRACGELVATPLPRDRPLWRLDVLTGSADGGVRIVLRLHHVLADGETAVRLASVLFGPRPPAREAAAVGRVPSWAALTADATRVRAGAALRMIRRPDRLLRAAGGLVRAVREAVAVARTAAGRPATSLNTPVRPGRRVAFLDLPLPELHAAAHRHGGTVNDAVLAIVGGGVRALLSHRGEATDRPLAASVPVSLHAGTAGDRGAGRPTAGENAAGPRTEPANAVAVAVVPLPLLPSCADRLVAIAAGSRELTRAARRTGTLGLLESRWAVRAALPLFRRQRLVQLFVTNVRGPRSRLALGGASLLRAYPVAPLNGNVTLGVAVLSYADTLGVGIVADRVSVPDLDVVVAGIQDAVAELLTGDGPGTDVAGPSADRPRVAKPRMPGSAARGADKRLRSRRFRPVAWPESFRVSGSFGPLLEGEVERARRWGEKLASAAAATGRGAGRS